jgi:sugar fermentation stimulation protein A
MRFPSPLIRGRLVKRYKRFLADVILDTGEALTAVCPNTGSMRGLTAPGATIWLSESDRATRKYRYTWEMIETDLGKGPTVVGINTGHPNALVAEAIAARRVKALAGYPNRRREVKYGVNSRIDLLLEDPARGLCYVEVKNVHLMRAEGVAEFPDSVTERGAKHLHEMAEMVRQGHRAMMVFLIQRQDARQFALASDIDPAYAAAFAQARAAGVEAIALRCRMSPEEIAVDRPVPIADLGAAADGAMPAKAPGGTPARPRKRRPR